MLTPNLLQDSRAVLACLRACQEASGLQLNVNTVVILPPWRPDPWTRHDPSFFGPRMDRLQMIKRAVVTICPGRGEAQATDKAKYLGFRHRPGVRGRHLGYDG